MKYQQKLVPIKRSIYIEMLSKTLAQFTNRGKQKTIDLTKLDSHTVLDLVSLRLVEYYTIKRIPGWILSKGEEDRYDRNDELYTATVYRIHALQKETEHWECIGQVELGKFTYIYTTKDNLEVKTNAGAFEVTIFERP